MERNLRLNDLKNKHKLPDCLTKNYPELSKIIINMTDFDPVKRPNSTELLKMIETELSLDFKMKDLKDEYSLLMCKSEFSKDMNKSNTKENKMARQRVFSDCISTIPSYEFKMKNFLDNKWKKM